MKISQFTNYELDIFRGQCNFTDIERSCFDYKARDWTDVQIAMELCVSESTVAVIMRKVRHKIDTVLKQNVMHSEEPQNDSCCKCIKSHTMAEWARIPDFLSKKNTLYVYSDYRTEGDVDIPRMKFGDGKHSLSELPFATMSITDDDMEYWDDKPDTENNDFGKIVEITETYDIDNLFTFPTDGYMMLEFDRAEDYAQVCIFGSSITSYFHFEKREGIDIHSKEIFVRRGMKCAFQSASEGAKIKFIPLV